LRLIWAVTCRSYELHEDETVDVEGDGVDEIWVPALGTEVELPVLLRFGLQEGEEALLRIELLAPEPLHMLRELETTIFGKPRPGHREGYEVPLVVPIALRFEPESEGIYSAEVFTDRRRETSLFFSVRVGEAPD
jgi:hypothetical protein